MLVTPTGYGGGSSRSQGESWRRGTIAHRLWLTTLYLLPKVTRTHSIHRLDTVEGRESRRHCPMRPPKEQRPRKLSGARTLYSVSTLESGTAVPTDGESRRHIIRDPRPLFGASVPIMDDQAGNLSGSTTERAHSTLSNCVSFCVVTGVTPWRPAGPHFTISTSPMARGWCRSPAGTCRCNMLTASRPSIWRPATRPACSTYRTWPKSGSAARMPMRRSNASPRPISVPSPRGAFAIHCSSTQMAVFSTI